MRKQLIIENTVNIINQLPIEKAEEIYAFADLILKRYKGNCLIQDIQHVAFKSQTFSFLHDEENLYSIKDIKTPDNS